MACRASPRFQPPASCDYRNASCVAALRNATSGGYLGRRQKDCSGAADQDRCANEVHALEPLPDWCASAELATATCASASFLALEYIDSCALSVVAGCEEAYLRGMDYRGISCEMRPGSAIRFSGPRRQLDPRDSSVDLDWRLEGEWLVGPPDLGRPNRSFWVYRADGEPHLFSRSELSGLDALVGTLPTTAQRANFECVTSLLAQAEEGGAEAGAEAEAARLGVGRGVEPLLVHALDRLT